MDLIPLIHFFIRACMGVFVIIDPFGASTHFLALTSRQPIENKKNIARRACLIGFGILIFFSFAGGALFKYFGLTLAALKIAGGILLFTIGLGMLYGKRSGTKATPEEEKDRGEFDDVAVIPMALPILSGPGAITTVMVFAGESPHSLPMLLTLFVAVAVCFSICYLVLSNSLWLLSILKTTGIKVLTRIMGLIMTVIAVQFVINGIADILPTLIHKINGISG